MSIITHRGHPVIWVEGFTNELLTVEDTILSGRCRPVPDSTITWRKNTASVRLGVVGVMVFQPPTLDAMTAFEIAGFLHWMTIALMRIHREPEGPFETIGSQIDSALDAAENSASFLTGKRSDHYPEFRP
jgi:hypothetical protein